MSSSDAVRRNYEVASLHAKLQAKTYENEMLKRLVRHLVAINDDSAQDQEYSRAPPPPTTQLAKGSVSHLSHLVQGLVQGQVLQGQ